MIGSRARSAATIRSTAGRPGGRSLQQPAVAADDLGRAVLGEPGERGVDPDQRVVLAAGVGDRERHLGGDHGPVAQHLKLAALTVLGARELQERHQRMPVVLGPVLVRQHEAGDPEQPALAGLPLQAGRRRATTGGVVHGDRLARYGYACRDQRQRRIGVAHPATTEIGEPRGVAPDVDVDRQPHPVTGQLDRCGVGVHDLAFPWIDHQNRRGGSLQHGWELTRVTVHVSHVYRPGH